MKLVETPQTIQVITHDIIHDQQAQNLNDVVRNMTGVISNNMYTSYTMRGFLNSYYNQFITFDGYIGNTYQAWTQMVQLYNIDKVEEIAGPASALSAAVHRVASLIWLLKDRWINPSIRSMSQRAPIA